MSEERAFLVEQIRERLRFYSEISALGLKRAEAAPAPAAAPPPERTTAEAPRPGPEPRRETPIATAHETLEVIREDLGECTRCALHAGRKNIVFGVGNANADLMFIGEGPGQEEDRQGFPFVGPAGQLLTKIIHAIDLTRDDVYIANVVKCRPPRNRDPEPEEVEACRPFVERQVDSVRPKVICALGRVAAQNLLRTEEGITRIRGRIFPFRGAKLVPTYHPAFLLRNPEKKRDCWEDMKLIRRLLAE